MIALPAGARILLATQPVDFRKGAHGLAALAAEMLGQDPFSGVVLVFRSRRAGRVTFCTLLVKDQAAAWSDHVDIPTTCRSDAVGH
ncbi:IS66 family insertion sequence element accessory protein TnpB [Roseomonas chloroacetimidivorans]|uniref:IS66 family insertion sequence element accessory protein TnpB n=1 Tax=Roseomonas chloroacetimidivorans TaxID=1766656 RepID=UPI003C73D1C1